MIYENIYMCSLGRGGDVFTIHAVYRNLLSPFSQIQNTNKKRWFTLFWDDIYVFCGNKNKLRRTAHSCCSNLIYSIMTMLHPHDLENWHVRYGNYFFESNCTEKYPFRQKKKPYFDVNSRCSTLVEIQNPCVLKRYNALIRKFLFPT